MRKIAGIVLPVLLAALLLSGCVFGGADRIGREEALQAALADAGLTKDQVRDIDIELERGLRSSWYEIEFEQGLKDYAYRVDAYTGDILSGGID